MEGAIDVGDSLVEGRLLWELLLRELCDRLPGGFETLLLRDVLVSDEILWVRV